MLVVQSLESAWLLGSLQLGLAAGRELQVVHPVPDEPLLRPVALHKHHCTQPHGVCKSMVHVKHGFLAAGHGVQLNRP